MKLSPIQKEIFEIILHFLYNNHEERVFVFSGVAGSGKTTIVKKLVTMTNTLKSKVATVTLTGMAANVLQEKGVPAQTIHSYLYDPIFNDDGTLKTFVKKPRSMFTEDFIFIDEGSMVPEDIFIDLYGLGKRIVVVGDINQIPSVSKSNFNLMDAAHIRLEEIHRQAEDSPIIQLSQHILSADTMPARFAGEKIQFVQRHKMEEHLYKYGQSYDTILCGTNNNRVKLNKIMRRTYKRSHPIFPEADDKVICLKNDYKVYPPIYNGDIFKVKYAAKDSQAFYVRTANRNVDVRLLVLNKLNNGNAYQMTIEDDLWHNGKYNYDVSLGNFDYAYAITVHKSQGSEYDNVCFDDENVSYFIDRTKFRYTAVTRSKDLLTIIR